MSSKKKHRPAPRPTATQGPLREGVDHLIAKGRFAEAVKQGKLCYRQESTPEHHRLLEKAYFLRAQQHQRGGLSNAAREVAEHLLEFGVTDPELLEPVAELLLAVGLADRAYQLQGRLETPEARARVAQQAADRAVLNPDQIPATLPEIRAGGHQIRAALAALDAGNEETALSGLRDLARGSPFSDWKLFVRGLAALRRRDTPEARANWDRLDPERAAARIARILLALDQPGTEAADATKLAALERRAFGEPVIGPLRDLGALIAADRWKEAVQAVEPLRKALRKIEPALAERLTRVLYIPLIRLVSGREDHAARSLLRNFAKAAAPLPIDPHWNRLWGMAHENFGEDFQEAEAYWTRYVDDLATLPALSAELRPVAQAVVWTYLGQQLIETADDMDDESPARRGRGKRRVDPEVAEARRDAVERLERALRICPTLREPYNDLIGAFESWHEPEKAAAVARRLLEVVPGDFETLIRLTDFHYEHDEPDKALAYALRARALKPRDEAALNHEWACRTALARQHALHGRFPEGRAERETAERLVPANSEGPLHAARKAAFELKAGAVDPVSELVATAQDRGEEPASLWLALWIEAIRYKLPEAEQARFESRCLDALSKKVRGETAAALVKVLGAYLSGRITYTGRNRHVEHILKYIGRTTRIKYRRDDLAVVCSVLSLMVESDAAYTMKNKAQTLLLKLAKRGITLFPEAYEFPFMLGTLEAAKGPFMGGFHSARLHLEKALALAEAARPTDPRAGAFVEQIKRALTTISDVPFDLPFSLPFGGSRSSNTAASFAAMIEAMADEMGLDFDDMDDFDDDDDRPPPRSAGPRSVPRKPRKRKR